MASAEGQLVAGRSSSSLFSRFGARLRTRTLDGGATVPGRMGEEGQPRAPRRPSIAGGEGEKRHSSSILARKSSSSELLTQNRPRRGSKIFHTLSASFATKTSIQGNEVRDGCVRTDSGQGGERRGNEEDAGMRRISSEGVGSDGYQQVEETDTPPELQQNDLVLDIHYTSASAYGPHSVYTVSGEEAITSNGDESRDGTFTPRRKRRLSLSLLSHRWSRADLSSPGAQEEPERDAAQNLNGLDSNPGSFNLRSFRNVRHGSDMSVERRPARVRSDSSTSDYPAMTDVQRQSFATASGVRTPTRVGSPVSDIRASSRSGSVTQSPASMSAGMFVRAAARSRADLLNNNAVEDECRVGGGGGGGSNSALGSPRFQGGSPYRPLTPLGQGAQSPAEELAILEADLAQARRSSLAFLAQLEQQEMRRERRRVNGDPAGLSNDSAPSPAPGSWPTSYFAPAYEHREISSPTSSLFQKLEMLESQNARGSRPGSRHFGLPDLSR